MAEERTGQHYKCRAQKQSEVFSIMFHGDIAEQLRAGYASNSRKRSTTAPRIASRQKIPMLSANNTDHVC